MLHRSIARASGLFFRRYTTEVLTSTQNSTTTEASSEASFASTSSSKRAEPQLLLKIRQDLKTALQNKDTERLSVIRSLIDAANKRPPTSDFQMTGIIRRFKEDSIVASSHYKIAERPDLVAKQDLQTQILAEYSSEVPTVDHETINEVVQAVFESLKKEGPKIRFNYFLKRCFQHPKLENKDVHRGDVVKAVRLVLNNYEKQQNEETSNSS